MSRTALAACGGGAARTLRDVCTTCSPRCCCRYVMQPASNGGGWPPPPRSTAGGGAVCGACVCMYMQSEHALASEVFCNHLCVETVLFLCHDLCLRDCDSRLPPVDLEISRSRAGRRGRSRGRGTIQSRSCPPRAAPLCIISHDCRHPHTGDLRPHAASASFRRWASCFASHWHCSHSRLLSPINVGAASSSSSERQRHETAKRCEGREPDANDN